jgi:iron complex outermembrane receptor protein
VVGGARITKDKKSSAFRYDVSGSPRPMIVPPDYEKTKPNYLIGLNWTPSQGTLIYGKYSTSFVSGGTTGGIPYDPEAAKSFELGAKVDFFDNRLRTNLALFTVDYNHWQQSQSTTTPSSQAIALPILTSLYGATTANEVLGKLSVFVGDQGKIRAKGFELELDAAPARGITTGGSLSYTKTTLPFVEPLVLAGNGGKMEITGRPEWTGSVYAAYQTLPLFGDSRLSVRVDGLYQSTNHLTSNEERDSALPANENVLDAAGFWTLNSRIALNKVKLGAVEGEFALWGKNLTNNKEATTALFTPLATSASYVPARAYGLDLTFEF